MRPCEIPRITFFYLDKNWAIDKLDKNNKFENKNFHLKPDYWLENYVGKFLACSVVGICNIDMIIMIIARLPRIHPPPPKKI